MKMKKNRIRSKEMSAEASSESANGTSTVAMVHTTANNTVLTTPGTGSLVPEMENNNGKAYMPPMTAVINNQGNVTG